MNVKNTLLTASILGLLSVLLGAFGAHALKPMLSAAGRVETFELAVRYSFYHTLALLATGILQHLFPSLWLRNSTLFFLLGIIFFSGSLYAICFTSVSFVVFITPVGGLFFIAGWIALLIGIGKAMK